MKVNIDGKYRLLNKYLFHDLHKNIFFCYHGFYTEYVPPPVPMKMLKS